MKIMNKLICTNYDEEHKSEVDSHSYKCGIKLFYKVLNSYTIKIFSEQCITVNTWYVKGLNLSP